MISLWLNELRKLRRRKGLFWASGTIVTLPAVGFAIYRAVKLIGDSNSTTEIMEGAGASVLIGLVCSVLAGAIIGSWDQSRGTARYILMSGTTRVRLMIAQILAVITYSVVLCLYGIIVFLILSFIIPGSSGGYDHLGSDTLHALVPSVAMAVFAYGIGLAIGEVGVTVAVSLITYFVLMIAGPLLGSWLSRYPWIEHIFLPDALARMFEPGKLWVSLAVVFVWLGAILGLAWNMLRRREF